MKEVDLFGIYVSPFVVDLVLAAILFLPLKIGLDRLGLGRLVWHRPLFDASLFVCTVALVTIGLARSGWSP